MYNLPSKICQHKIWPRQQFFVFLIEKLCVDNILEGKKTNNKLELDGNYYSTPIPKQRNKNKSMHNTADVY